MSFSMGVVGLVCIFYRELNILCAMIENAHFKRKNER